MIAEPAVKHDNAKQLVRAVRAPRSMIGTQLVDDLSIKHPTAPRRTDAITETIAKPCRGIEVSVELAHVKCQRRIESVLRQLFSSLGEHLGEGISKNDFSA